jgi:glycosyltransferase involved in cell wall biosynthesis
MSICFNAVSRVLIEKNLDLVHVHAAGPSMYAIFPRLIGIPTVVQTHGLEWRRDKWGVVAKAFFKMADFTAVYFPNKTTAVSIVQKNYYEKKFGKEIKYIPPGVSVAKKRKPRWLLEQGLAPHRYILFAARLVEEKGAHYLIEAFRTIQTDIKLVIAGDAAHAEKYRALIRDKANGDQRIVFPGFVTGRPLEELFGNAYIFCLPSTLEGLPIALLEAMSYGNCCLVSNIPENMEAIGDYGYTFKNRNVQDLRRKLQNLIENPEHVELKKEMSRKHVLQNYSWDMIADQMEAFYYSILKGRSTR